jgi:iron(III) transport system substrate-binding protein
MTAQPLGHFAKIASRASLALAVMLAVAPCPRAQTIQDVAALSGPDRTDKIIAGAKKEGALMIYTSLQVEDLAALSTVFEKKYGVKINVWRGSAEDVRQRAIVENRANRREVDMFELGGREMESLHREKLLQAVKSPVFADLTPQAVIPHGEWVGTRLNVIVGAYNTNLVKKADLPKSYEDLTDARFKGKIGIESEDQDWLATIVGEMGEEKGLKLFRDIVAKNGISVRKGHTLLVNLTASGEVPIALTTYSYKANQLKTAGAPLDFLGLQPSVARVNGVGVSHTAPHPHAAVLFFDFILGEEGQKILYEREFSPTNRKVQELPADQRVIFSNVAQMLDEQDKWTKLYREIFVQRAAR